MQLYNILYTILSYLEFKETQKQMEVDEEPTNSEPLHEFNPDLAIAAEHTQKMKARWDKIQKKEAKKAQKSANMRRSAQAVSFSIKLQYTNTGFFIFQ